MKMAENKKEFPILASILLILGIVWLLQDLGYLTINIPWVPVVIIVVAIGLIFNRFLRE